MITNKLFDVYSSNLLHVNRNTSFIYIVYDFSGIYGQNLVKKFNDDFMNIAPMSLLYQERYSLRDKEITNEITNTIREYYFGHDDIDESDKARFNVINVSNRYFK